MTKIAVAGPASGTGTFTLTTPVSSSDRTLTFPDSTGTVLNDQSNIEAQVKTATSATGAAPIFSCRSWVNFNGSGTVAIRANGNVSSITDNGTGNYTVNFATALPDANYCVSATGKSDIDVRTVNLNPSAAHFATGSIRVLGVLNSDASVFDVDFASVSIFR